MKVEQRNLLKAWREELRLMTRTHYELSIKIRRMNYYLGIPLIVIPLLIAGYILFTLTQDAPYWMKMAIGLLALLTAILASLQTFLKYSEQAENHRNASARYQALFNMIDQHVVMSPKDEEALSQWCDKLRERWDELNLEAPSIPRKMEPPKDVEFEPIARIDEDLEQPRMRGGKQEPRMEFNERFEDD